MNDDQHQPSSNPPEAPDKEKMEQVCMKQSMFPFAKVAKSFF